VISWEQLSDKGLKARESRIDSVAGPKAPANRQGVANERVVQ
jgi:hypothetical protein